MPQGQFAEELRKLRAEQGNRPPVFGFQEPPSEEQFIKDEWETTPTDRAIATLPEAAGLVAQFIPGGQTPKALMTLIRLIAPAIGEMGRQSLSGEEFSPGNVLTRTALNTVPAGLGQTPKAAAAAGRSLTRSSLARGAASSMGDDVAENLATAGTGLKAEADVTRMASALEREGGATLKAAPGAKGPTGLPDITPQDAQRFARYAKELRAAQKLHGGAKQAYLRKRPETAAAVQRAGGDFNAAAEEFEALANTLVRTAEGAARQGFNWPRFLAGAGIGGMVDYATGIPGVGTAAGLGIGGLEASIPLRLAAGQQLTRIGSNPYAPDVIEAATRGALATGAAATAGPRRRRLER